MGKNTTVKIKMAYQNPPFATEGGRELEKIHDF